MRKISRKILRFLSVVGVIGTLMFQAQPLMAYEIEELENVYLYSDQTIKEGESAHFQGFIDDNCPDPVSEVSIMSIYTVSMNYGEGNGFKLLPGDYGRCVKFNLPSHKYENSGSYQVTLKVKYIDPNGDIIIKTDAVTVKVSNNAPSVSITPKNPTVTEGSVVTLKANVSGGNSPLSYQWSGACSGNTTKSTAPSTVGSHKCIVTVTDKDGDKASDSSTVTVVKKEDDTDPGDDGNDEQDDSSEQGRSEESYSNDSWMPTGEEEVLGAQTCNAKFKLGGYVYVDENENESMDSDEDGSKGVYVKVYMKKDGEYKLLKKLTTDKNGLWNMKVCKGSYRVFVDSTTLPEGYMLEGEQYEDIKVKKSVDGVNFAIVENEDSEESVTDEENDVSTEEVEGVSVTTICVSLLLLAYGLFNFLMIVDATRRDEKDLPDRKKWIIAMIFLPGASIAYLMKVRMQS